MSDEMTGATTQRVLLSAIEETSVIRSSAFIPDRRYPAVGKTY